jgi:23S rRNA (guanosine2251-2'-O)-methyltransferase
MSRNRPKSVKNPKKISRPSKPSKPNNQAIIYGINTVELLLSKLPHKIITVFYEDKSDHKIANNRINKIINLAKANQIPVQLIKPTTIDKWFSEQVNHQGVLAQITPTASLNEADLIGLITDKLETNPVVLVLDNIQDPRNLGACLRNALAFGVTAVVLSKNASCDITPTVKKVACGAADLVPIAKVSNLDSCLKKLQQLGVWTIALDASGSQDLAAIDLNMPLALVLGSEDKGVRRIIKEHSDFIAKIPMQHTGIDSLNLSVAAGICLYEVVRQRIS